MWLTVPLSTPSDTVHVQSPVETLQCTTPHKHDSRSLPSQYCRLQLPKSKCVSLKNDLFHFLSQVLTENWNLGCRPSSSRWHRSTGSATVARGRLWLAGGGCSPPAQFAALHPAASRRDRLWRELVGKKQKVNRRPPCVEVSLYLRVFVCRVCALLQINLL